jgi:pullulanase
MARHPAARTQGVPFFCAGDELLRSKSVDRDSYASGDWFNAIMYDGSVRANGSNPSLGFQIYVGGRSDARILNSTWEVDRSGAVLWQVRLGIGLPVRAKNGDLWATLRPLLDDAALVPSPPDVRRTMDHFAEMLAVRRSSSLFRLQSAADVATALRFLDTPSASVIAMVLDPAGGADDLTSKSPSFMPDVRRFDRVAVVFNASSDAVEVDVVYTSSCSGRRNWALHPVCVDSTDERLRTQCRARTVTGSQVTVLTVAALTTAVFVQQV